jgi:transcriptional regulator with XRE-family HTH domain
MDDQRLGRAIRALRHRLSWRQVDLGHRAGVSQDLISLVERGRLDAMPLRTIRAVAAALDLPDTSTARRHARRHDPVLGRAYPVRGDQLRAQLRSGALTAAGLLFVSGQTARRLTSRRIRGSRC